LSLLLIRAIKATLLEVMSTSVADMEVRVMGVQKIETTRLTGTHGMDHGAGQLSLRTDAVKDGAKPGFS
jgi:hypothetical protein